MQYKVETTSLGRYLDDVDDGDVKLDQAVQRDFCWSKGMMNALIYSAVSKEIYIPPIILAEQKKEEDEIKTTYVVDAGQRTESLHQFRLGKYKTTKEFRNYLIQFKKEERDEDGNVVQTLDYFDIRNKTYNDLPSDLKKNFNKCQITQVIYQDCTPEQVSELVLLYNNHLGMNASQKSLTYVGRFADEIKQIKNNNRFLMDGTALTETEKKKGVWERVISESVMAVKHFSDWKSQPQKMCDYLNQHSSEEEYKLIEKYFDRLAPYVDKLENKNVSNLFVSKDICVWMMLFDRFNKLHLPDDRFGQFLNAFVSGLQNKELGGISWKVLDSDRHTKDKSLIAKKVDHLEKLMNDFLHINEEKNNEDAQDNIKKDTPVTNVVSDEDISVIDFVRENVKSDVDEEDIDLYYEMLDKDYDIDKTSKLLDWQNEPSLIAIIAYSFEQDIELNSWIKDFFSRNSKYLKNQKENYIYMKADLLKFLERR